MPRLLCCCALFSHTLHPPPPCLAVFVPPLSPLAPAHWCAPRRHARGPRCEAGAPRGAPPLLPPALRLTLRSPCLPAYVPAAASLVRPLPAALAGHSRGHGAAMRVQGGHRQRARSAGVAAGGEGGARGRQDSGRGQAVQAKLVWPWLFCIQVWGARAPAALGLQEAGRLQGESIRAWRWAGCRCPPAPTGPAAAPAAAASAACAPSWGRRQAGGWARRRG